MTDRQIALWFYLKKTHPSLFQLVASKVPESVVASYNAQSPPAIDDALLADINADVLCMPAGSQDSSNQRVQSSPITQEWHPQLLKEPADVLAYLYVAGSRTVIERLDAELSDEQKQQVVTALSAMSPHRWPLDVMMDFLQFLHDRYPILSFDRANHSSYRIMEKLMPLGSPANDAYLNPYTDMGLFSLDDQRQLLMTAHRHQRLIPFLQTVPVSDRATIVSSLPKRQQAVILGAVLPTLETSHALSARNGMIETIRQLQDTQAIDPGVKHA